MRKKDDDAILSLRLSAKDAERLQHEARSRGTTISKIAREAIVTGLHPAATASLSYGITSNATLSISMIGVGLPETSTGGGLAAESDPK